MADDAQLEVLREVEALSDRFGADVVARACRRFTERQAVFADFPPTDFDPEQVWAKSPASLEMIDRVLAAPQLPFAVLDSELDWLRLAFALQLRFAVPHVLIYRRMASQAKLSPYLDTFLALINSWQALRNYRNVPPKPDAAWLIETRDWAQRNSTETPTTGRIPDDGDQFFFGAVLAIYRFAYGRGPSATLGGPTFRFCRSLWDELTELIDEPRWPPINDRALHKRIALHKNADLSDKTSFLPAEALVRLLKARQADAD